MTTRLFQNSFHRSIQIFLLFFVPCLCGALFSLSHAKQPSITSDGTLGTNISIDGSNYTISDGTIRGGNQFHSFGQFNVFEGESANFTGPNSISNIIGRVTGGSKSFINGLLSSEINGANLYLLNPSGVMFGPNAELNLSGSFHVSTADYLRLGDSGIFYAAISENSVLTMDPPTAFGFLNGNPAGISIDESWLEVPEGETISVVGGGIEIEGGLLLAPSGQMNIASVASTGEVLFGSDEMRVDSIESFGDISLVESTAIDTSGDGGGTLRIRGGKLVIEDSSLSADTWGDVDGGDIFIGVTDSVSMSGGSISTETGGDGDAGNITLMVGNLELTNESLINSESYGTCKGGDVTVEATDAVSILEESSINSQTEVDGQAGSISISSPKLTMADGGHISATCDGDGNAGDIALEVNNLELTSGSFITSESYGLGNSGDIIISATDSLTMQASGIGSRTNTDSSGNAGKIKISSPKLTMADGGHISTTGEGDGDADDITLYVKKLELTSGSFITSESYGLGNSGDIIIFATNSLTMQASGIGSGTNTDSSGNAGKIIILSPKLTMADGGHISTTGEGDGDVGDITLEVSKLVLTNDSYITSESFGEGKAGNIHITSKDEFMIEDSHILTEAAYSDGGNIKIDNKQMVMLINSEISSSVNGGPDTTGGNISIDPEFVILKGSKIIANVFEGKGGDIDIVTDVFLADLNSLIDASSKSGIDSVVIGNPLSISPALLFEKLRSAVELLKEPCLARMQGGKYSSLFVSGRGALPVEPGGLMPSPAFMKLEKN